MQLHNLEKNSSNATRKRVGRGGKRGKTSGSGHKGQKARAGNSTRPEMRDTIKKIPKLRGHGLHGNRPGAIMTDNAAVNLKTLEEKFEKGEIVSPKTLLALKLIEKQNGKIPTVKILATGEIKKALIIRDCLVSKTAAEKITQAGGEIRTKA